MACNCKPGIYAHPHEPDASHPTGVRHSYQPCQCKGQPMRKPYSERTHGADEWVAPPCPCKGGQYARSGDHVPEQGFGHSHAGHEESAARSREMTEILQRLAKLESASRDHDAVLMYTTDRINRMERSGAKVVPQSVEKVPGTITLTPGPITGAAPPEQARSPSDITESLVAELRKRTELGLAKYGTTVDGAGLFPAQWLQHLKEELLDAVQYIEAARRAFDSEYAKANAKELPKHASGLVDKVVEAIRAQPSGSLVLVSYIEPTEYGTTATRVVECKPGDVIHIPPRAYRVSISRSD